MAVFAVGMPVAGAINSFQSGTFEAVYALVWPLYMLAAASLVYAAGFGVNCIAIITCNSSRTGAKNHEKGEG